MKTTNHVYKYIQNSTRRSGVEKTTTRIVILRNTPGTLQET
jgi:hypothetical protein